MRLLAVPLLRTFFIPPVSLLVMFLCNCCVKLPMKEKIPYKEGEEVMLLVESFTDLGVNVIIDGRYEGLLYKSDIFQELAIGEQLEGYIKKIREDNKIDVTLRKGGLDDIKEARETILAKLKEHYGFLLLSDKSSPELIRETLQMSKNYSKSYRWPVQR